MVMVKELNKLIDGVAGILLSDSGFVQRCCIYPHYASRAGLVGRV